MEDGYGGGNILPGIPHGLERRVAFLVGESGVGEDGHQGPVHPEGAVAYAQERGEEARDDEDGQEDDQRRREARRRHADEPLALGPRWEHDGCRVVFRLLQGERQVSR